MVSKLKNISDNQLATTIKDSTQQIWLAGLGAFAKAQQEGGKVFEALVREGQTLQRKGQNAAEERALIAHLQASSDKAAQRLAAFRATHRPAPLSYIV